MSCPGCAFSGIAIMQGPDGPLTLIIVPGAAPAGTVTLYGAYPGGGLLIGSAKGGGGGTAPGPGPDASFAG